MPQDLPAADRRADNHGRHRHAPRTHVPHQPADAPVAVGIEVDLQAPYLRHLAARARHRRIDAAEHVAARLVRGAEHPLTGGMAPVAGKPGELPHPGPRTLAQDDRGVLPGAEQLREPLHGGAVPGRSARQERRAAHRPLPAAAPRATRSATANAAGPAAEQSGCSTRTGYTARGDGKGAVVPQAVVTTGSGRKCAPRAR